MKRLLSILTLLIYIVCAQCAYASSARGNVRVYGYVVDSDNRGIEFANVYIEGTTYGVTTNHNGFYDLQFTRPDTAITLTFSMLGYETMRQVFLPQKDVINVNVELPTNAEMLQAIEVRGLQRQVNSMDQIDALTTRVLPNTSGGIESLLITFTGVTQNNELSSQYNVRGGSFDENSVYVNGIEVHRPFLVRAGQQEGLSFVNPDMTQTVQFSAGGFDAQYTDKMSSVLDITYKTPRSTEATLSLSLLGAQAYVGFGGEHYSQMHSLRYKTSRYFMTALPTKATYNPDFIDYQTYMHWDLNRKQTGSKWSMGFLGNFSQNSYSFIPSGEAVAFGSFQTARKINKDIVGQEKDLFRTAFAALTTTGQWDNGVKANFTLSGYYTNERESYDITTDYILSIAEMDESTGTTGGSNGASTTQDITTDKEAAVLGRGTYHEHARNSLQAASVNVQHDGEWRLDNNRLRWGISAEGMWLNDYTSEWEWRDSAGYSMPQNSEALELYYAQKGDTRLNALRVQGYAQNTYTWNTDKGDVLLTGGVRFNYWTYNREPLISPRLSVVYMPGWKHDVTLRLATGLYYQAPSYKELRNTLTYESGLNRVVLNDQLKAQRSAQVILGADYYFRAWGRPFKFTAEAYYKYMDRLVSYSVDNVRVRYSGVNDSHGYTTGLDLKLYGELVPGADSWISFSCMRSREKLDNDPDGLGWISRSNEQRYNLTVFFQDYFPRWPQYVFHIKLQFADGLPYGYPRNLNTRNQLRSSSFKRIDLGVSRVFRYGKERWMKNPHVDAWWLQFEALNLIGFRNVNSYSWLTDYTGIAWAVPNYLTGRLFNFKIIVDLK